MNAADLATERQLIADRLPSFVEVFARAEDASMPRLAPALERAFPILGPAGERITVGNYGIVEDDESVDFVLGCYLETPSAPRSAMWLWVYTFPDDLGDSVLQFDGVRMVVPVENVVRRLSNRIEAFGVRGRFRFAMLPPEKRATLEDLLTGKYHGL